MKADLLKANVAIFFAELFNALNVNAQRYLLPEWSTPFAMLLMRTAFGAALFWTISFFIKEKRVERKDLFLMLSGGAVSLTAYISFYLLGVEKSSPIDSSLIMSTMPLVVLALAIFLFGEKISKLKILGILFGIIGTVLLIIIQENPPGGKNTIVGNVFCFMSAVAYGFYLITNKKLAGKYSAATMLKWMFSGAFVLSIPLTFIFGWSTPVLEAGTNWKPIAVLIFVMLFPTGLTYFLIPYAMKRLVATTVAMYDYEVPIVASIVGVALGQALFEWYQPVSALFIFAGVYLVSRENRRLRAKYQMKDPIED
ncbi:MAG: DMT family transporter [Bacteroidales bacterium]